MTAIFGISRFDGDDPSSGVSSLARALRKFGPHGSTELIDGPTFLGRHLWAMLAEDDLPESTDCSKERRYLVVSDVRLSEREDLARQLDLVEAVRLSDSAIVAAALERWNEQAFERIYGSFAVAAWDRRERRLLLARDHLGFRPLLYHHDARRLAFASMPEGLFALADVPRANDQDTMRRFLRLLQPLGSATPFRNIHRVQPGHYACVTAEGVTQHRYWYPELSPLKLSRHQDYEDKFRLLIDSAVGSSLRNVTGCIGAHLSAGYDSTTVVTAAARLLAETDTDIVAFTGSPRSGFAGESFENVMVDESVIAARTAALYHNIEHVRVESNAMLSEDIDILTVLYSSPILNMCNSWCDAINREARRRGITVMLEGFMGNATVSDTGMTALSELLRAGRFIAWWRIARGLLLRKQLTFPRILWHSLSSFLPNGIWLELRKAAGRYVLPLSRAIALRATERMQLAKELQGEEANLYLLDRSYSDETWRDSKTGQIARALIMNNDNGITLKSILAIYGIDVRDPTGDRRLAEFSLRVPIEHFIWDGEPRAMVRSILRDRVAAEMLANRRSGYQGADWALAMPKTVEELNAQLDRIENFEATDALIDVDRLRALAKEWPDVLANGNLTDIGTIADYRLAMTRALATAAFMRKTAGSNA